MKAKRLFQIFVLLALLFSPLGSVSASTGSVDQLDAMVINRSLNLWDATYFGFVSSGIFENWQFEFTESHHFVVTVTPISGDFRPRSATPWPIIAITPDCVPPSMITAFAFAAARAMPRPNS